MTQNFHHLLSKNGSNCASLATKFGFAHNTSVNTATGSTPYETIFGSKPQIPLPLKLGLMRDTRKLCHSDFCEGLHHTLTIFRQQIHLWIDCCINVLQLDFTQENQFKRLYAETYRVSRETTDKANEYRNKHKLRKELQVGQVVLRENFNQNSINQRNCLLSVQGIHGYPKDYKYHL